MRLSDLFANIEYNVPKLPFFGHRVVWLWLMPTLISLLVFAFLLSIALKLHRRESSLVGESTLREVIDLIDRDYVDEPDRDRLVEGAVNGMLRSLDPYSRGYSPTEWREFSSTNSGRYSGIGIVFGLVGRYMTILRVYPDSPAERAGLKGSERILRVDTLRIGAGASAQRLRRRLDGPDGSPVEIEVSSFDGTETKTRTVLRGEYAVSKVSSRVVELAGGSPVAYVRISGFDERSSSDTQSVLEAAIRAEVGSVILDLRGNNGGDLQAAVDVVGLFVSSPKVLRSVYRSSHEDYATKGSPLVPALPLILLIDGETASAAEVVAAALQDFRRALIVGQPSFGKGVVQNVYELATRSGGVKLTTARWLTPSGAWIQRAELGRRGGDDLSVGGIEPDVSVYISEDENEGLQEEWERSEYHPRVLEALRDGSAAPPRDQSLERAFDILKGLPSSTRVPAE